MQKDARIFGDLSVKDYPFGERKHGKSYFGPTETVRPFSGTVKPRVFFPLTYQSGHRPSLTLTLEFYARKIILWADVNRKAIFGEIINSKAIISQSPRKGVILHSPYGDRPPLTRYDGPRHDKG